MSDSPFLPCLDGLPASFHGLLRRYAERLAGRPEATALSAVLAEAPQRAAELSRLWIASDYAAELCIRQPGLLLELLASGDLARPYGDWPAHLAAWAGAEAWDAHADAKAAEAALKGLLRRFRQREMLRILWRDVNGLAGLEQTVTELSALADAVIDFALAWLQPWLCRELGEPRSADGSLQRLCVLALGKYGAQELNLSSDIDLIFCFAEGGETEVSEAVRKVWPRARPISIQTFFIKLGQRLIDALDTLTAEGFVFRVDMRLRPYGGSGALALSFDAMEEYYQTQGREWERFALLKARACAGDVAGGLRLLQALHPFVYRRYLDFAAIDALRDMKGRIRQQVARKGMEDNIKLGHGGIREVEFIVQVFQLIHGGRNRRLQVAGLLPALDTLAEDGLLVPADAEALLSAYRFLRRLEHALQAVHDKQTQKLPADPGERARVACALGYDAWEALAAELTRVRDEVAGHFQALIAESGEAASADAGQAAQYLALWRGELDESKALALLEALGYQDPGTLLASVAAYRSSRAYLALEPIAQGRFERFMATLLPAAARAERPDLAFARVFSFVQQVSRRTAYLVLLLENALALRQLVELCHSSPWIVETLSRHPVLLDELLKPLAAPPPRAELADDLRQQLLRLPQEDLDQQIEALVYFKQVHVLKVAAADLAGTLPLMKVSDYLTHIAETLLEQVLQLAWDELIARHGPPCNGAGEAGSLDFVIVAYGKLGGIELSYGSDLDLVFLHDGHPDLDTVAGEGQRAVNSRTFYSRLGQRIINMLSTATFGGKLYEIDLRLRPSGASGLLVSAMSAYAHYQHQEAWTWEHQALIRARPVAGSASLAEDFAALRHTVLSKPRALPALREDIRKMRQRMRMELGTVLGTPLFDIKQDTGGLVDIEFIVQYLVLGWAERHPELTVWSDNMRLLDTAQALSLLTAEERESLQQVYLRYRHRLHRLALQQESHILPRSEYADERAAIARVWDRLFPPGEGE